MLIDAHPIPILFTRRTTVKKRLAAAALAAAMSLSATAAPAQAMLTIEFAPMSSLPNPQQIINDWTRQAQQFSSQFIPGNFLPGPAPAPVAGPVSPQQQQLIDATNRYRVSRGLRPLAPMPQLNALAQDWANTMAREDNLRHRPNYNAGYPRGWRWASENVIVWQPPQSADSLVQKWSTSPGHNANMLRPEATHIGVGVAVNGAGHQYAVQNFAAY